MAEYWAFALLTAIGIIGQEKLKENYQPMARSKKKLRFLYLTYCAVVFAVCLVVFEFILRLCGFGNLVIYDQDELLYWKPKPNQHAYTKINRQEVRINQHGTRGRDFFIPKPDSLFRVLSLGDSRTFGWGLAESETYSHLLENLLNSENENARIEVVNAGVNGWSYDQIFLYLRESGLSFEPDLVILGMANLWTQFSEDSSEEFRNAFVKRVILKNLLRRSALYHYIVEVKLKNYYEEYRKKLIPPQEKRPDDEMFASAPDRSTKAIKTSIHKIIDILHERQIPLIFLSIPTQGEVEANNESRLSAIVSEFSKDRGLSHINVSSEFSQRSKSFYLEADPIHPTAAGNRIIAHSLRDRILKDILEWQTRSNGIASPLVRKTRTSSL